MDKKIKVCITDMRDAKYFIQLTEEQYRLINWLAENGISDDEFSFEVLDDDSFEAI